MYRILIIYIIIDFSVKSTNMYSNLLYHIYFLIYKFYFTITFTDFYCSYFYGILILLPSVDHAKLSTAEFLKSMNWHRIDCRQYFHRSADPMGSERRITFRYCWRLFVCQIQLNNFGVKLLYNGVLGVDVWSQNEGMPLSGFHYGISGSN